MSTIYFGCDEIEIEELAKMLTDGVYARGLLPIIPKDEFYAMILEKLNQILEPDP